MLLKLTILNVTDVLKRALDDIDYVRIRERIIHVLSAATKFNEIFLAKLSQLMRYRGFSHSDYLRDLTNAKLAPIKRKEYAKASFITNKLEKLCQGAYALLGRKLAAYSLSYMLALA